MALRDAIIDIQQKALNLSGVKRADDDPPESMSEFPFAVSYVVSGVVPMGSHGFSNYLHVIFCEIHIARTILADSISRAMPYIESMALALINDPTLGDTVQSVNEISYEFGELKWGEDSHIGVRFSITVKTVLQ